MPRSWLQRRAGGRTVDNLTQHIIAWGGFFPGLDAYLGRLVGTSAQGNVLFSQPETPVTKQAATAAPLRPLIPHFLRFPATSPGSGGGFLRSATRPNARRAIEPEEPVDPVDAGRRAREMHRAHTTWFFGAVLLASIAQHVPFHPDYPFLFNSYYVSAGPARPPPARQSPAGRGGYHAYRAMSTGGG